MNAKREVPTIHNAWEAFERDLVAGQCDAETLAFFKLVWHSGAMAMGIIMASSENTITDKREAFRHVAEFLASTPHFLKFRSKLQEWNAKQTDVH